MKKVDTVSLINMILPKPDTSKGSWGDSAFKDIFSVNNSSNIKSNKIPYDKIFLQSNVYYKGWFDDYDSLEVEVFDLNEDIKEQLFGGKLSYLN